MLVRPLAAFSLAALALPAARAVDAASLASFEGIEEPALRYYPAKDSFAPDDHVNITEAAPGVFRMELRYGPEWWDSDRDTRNRDRQRAEVKGLGPHQRDGQTFEYATTWRVDPAFTPGPRFCHIFQLKATDGDNGAPAVTMTLTPVPGRVEVRCTPLTKGAPSLARRFAYRPGEWETVRIRIKVSAAGEGLLQVSVDGDPFQGLDRVAICRPEGTDYRPKWGLYRGVTAGMAIHDDTIEHRQVSAVRLDAPPEDRAAAEREAALVAVQVDRAAADPVGALGWALAQPSAEARQDALFRIYDRWANRDAAASRRWLLAHAPDLRLDNLLWYEATDTTTRYVERARALECCAAITTPLLREKAYAHVIGIWARDRSQLPEVIRFIRGQARLDAAEQEALIARISAASGEN
ncbi:MAG TPA: heparin lyase I family protein [Opitutaceae bacterium]|nr:heparin lyase I family protein [Opitutaceae bacterium]